MWQSCMKCCSHATDRSLTSGSSAPADEAFVLMKCLLSTSSVMTLRRVLPLTLRSNKRRERKEEWKDLSWPLHESLWGLTTTGRQTAANICFRHEWAWFYIDLYLLTINRQTKYFSIVFNIMQPQTNRTYSVTSWSQNSLFTVHV